MKIPTLGPGETLLVDQAPSAGRQVARWLSRAGHKVDVAATPEDCLALLDRSLPDLVILNLEQVSGAGVELLNRVKLRNSRLPVVVLTDSTAVENAVGAMQAGAYDCLVHPVDELRLITVVKNAIAFQRLATQVVSLEREVRGQGYGGMVGQSRAMKALYKQLDRVAASDITVVIYGESGTGKELIAQAIHKNSSRSDGPLVALNCAAVPESLQESEIFGHEKGAFTGAIRQHAGKFEQADNGTLFFDEVAELSPGLQAKLLRVLQERTFQRVGGTEYLTVDVRVIAATHRNLTDEIEAGRFREDLYYRLAVLELDVPPLRKRDGDIALLATMFLEQHDMIAGIDARSFALDALEFMVRYPWPGNVRELENAVHRAAVLAEGELIQLSDLPARIRDSHGDTEEIDVSAERGPQAEPDQQPERPVATLPMGTTLAELERHASEAAVARAKGNISAAARELGISRGALYRKLKEYGIQT